MAKDKRLPMPEGSVPNLTDPWDDGVRAFTTAQLREFIQGELRARQVKGVRLNGELLEADADGVVPVSVNDVEIDESINEDSTNPVQNAAIAAALASLRSGTVYNMDFVPTEAGGTLTLYNQTGGVVADCEIPALGGGSSDVDMTRIVLTAQVDRSSVSEGGQVTLTCNYDVVNQEGVTQGQQATVTTRIVMGAMELYNVTNNNVTPGQWTLNISKYLVTGTCGIYVTVEFYDAVLEKTRSKSAYTEVKVVSLKLSTTYTLTEALRTGGYDGRVDIPFTVSGAGTKRISLYLDGASEAYAYKEITATSSTADRFTVDCSALSAGAHSLQMVARTTIDGQDYTSQSVWIALLRHGQSAMVGMMATDPDGVIVTGAGHMLPTLKTKTLEPVTVMYGAYDASRPQASVEVSVDGQPAQTLTVERVMQTLTRRFSSVGDHTLAIRCGSSVLEAMVRVSQGDISIEDVQGGLTVSLDATGRSNSESARDVWAYEDVDTTFEGVDWSSSGWNGTSLVLLNGAKARVNAPLFKEDLTHPNVKETGLTVEVTLTISNITDDSVPIVSCMDEGKGLRIMGNEITLLTGEIVTYLDEDEEERTRECKLSTNYVDGKRMKVAWVIRKALKDVGGTNVDDRVMELYVNGNRAGADTYGPIYNFTHNNPTGLLFDSTSAKIEIERIRVYSRALTDDEELCNDIYDEPDIEAMVERYNENDVLNDDEDIDMNAILGRGKGVILIVHVNPDHEQYGDYPLGDVYATNSKNTDFTADVFYYSPLGRELDFVLRGCNIRIQGTSSTKYPSKNIRIYFNKSKTGANDKPIFTVNGVPDTSYKYALRPGSPKQTVMTAKSDYSDSSMSLNTGGAKLFNQAMIELGLLTPPQRWQLEHGQAINVRQAIDGIPVDIFVAEHETDTPLYAGQYNFNNEKSKSQSVFGMELSGFEPSCPIALESLNNLEKLCLFQGEPDLDAQLTNTFDDAFEFNYPEDVFWSQTTVDEKSDMGKTAHLATDTQKSAVRRLMVFIRDCATANGTRTPNPGDLSTFTSQYFIDHASEYFDVTHLLTYYDFTDRFVSVDQRAKNILWRTWDGLIWYATYYDGDTQRGKRNDSFMVYGPETDRGTYDAQRSKYAFEGYTSWLWCLVLANMQSELRAASINLGRVLTVQRVLNMLLVEQSGNWSDREFNKSGEIKYITPAIRMTYGKMWPFIFALQGSDKSHSEWFIRQRWSLMDAKNGADAFTSDDLSITLSRDINDPTDYITIVLAKLYASGFGTNNNGFMHSTGLLQPGAPARMPVTAGLNANDPLRVYGASRIRRLDMSECYQRVQGSFDISKATLLEELDMHVPAGRSDYSREWWIAGIENCALLKVLDLTGQRDASTTSTGRSLDLSGQANLRELRAKGTAIRQLALAPGAAVRTLLLPGTLTALSLESLHSLTDSGLDIDSMASVTALTVRECEGIDTLALVRRWLADLGDNAANLSLTLTGINWSFGFGKFEWLISLVPICSRKLSLSGAITLHDRLDSDQLAALSAAFPGCFSDGPLRINVEDKLVTREDNPKVMAICHQRGWAHDADYMTFAEASAVTSLGTAFQGTDIEHFDEFQYFGVTYLDNGEFSGCASLTSLTLPENLVSFNILSVNGCASLDYLRITAKAVHSGNSNQSTIGSNNKRLVLACSPEVRKMHSSGTGGNPLAFPHCLQMWFEGGKAPVIQGNNLKNFMGTQSIATADMPKAVYYPSDGHGYVDSGGWSHSNDTVMPESFYKIDGSQRSADNILSLVSNNFTKIAYDR